MNAIKTIGLFIFIIGLIILNKINIKNNMLGACILSFVSACGFLLVVL